MKTLIQSYYSEDSNCVDGFYEVTVPERWTYSYNELISEVGKLLDAIQYDSFKVNLNFDESDYNCIKEDIILKNWDYAVELTTNLGSNLERTLQFIIRAYEGFEYEKRSVEQYDADYNEFK